MALIILGVASSLGLITIYDDRMVMSKDMQTNAGGSMLMLQDTSKNNITSELSDENNVTAGNVHTMSPDMNM